MANSARIDELRKKFDENPRRYFAPLANEYRKAGDLEQAIFICQEYLPQQPGHMSGHIVYGQALFEMSRMEEAQVVFETALSLDPENLIALRHLGDITRHTGDLSGARIWYQRVLEADPRNEEIAQIMLTLLSTPEPPVDPRGFTPRTSPAVTYEPQADQPTATVTPERDADSGSGFTVEKSEESALPSHAEPPPPPPQPPHVGAGNKAIDGHDFLDLNDFNLGGVPLASIASSEPTADDVFAPAPQEHEQPDSGDGIVDEELFVETPITAPADFAFASEPEAAPDVVDERSAEPETAPAQPEAVDEAGVFTLGQEDGPFELDPFAIAAGSTQPVIELATDLNLGLPDDGTSPDMSSDMSSDVSADMTSDVTSAIPPDDTLFVDGLESFESGVLADARLDAPLGESIGAASLDGADLYDIPPAAEPVRPAEEEEEQSPLVWSEPESEADVASHTGGADSAPAPAFVTETMAELYLQQGHLESAMGIYAQLVEQRPDDDRLRRRLMAVEDRVYGTPAVAAPSETESAPAPVYGGPTIREFLSGLVTRRTASVSQPAAAAESFEQYEPEQALAPVGGSVYSSSSSETVSGSIDALFSGADASSKDVIAASTLQEAFAPDTGDATPLQGKGMPAHRASSELSLDHVFKGNAPPPSDADGFSFDQFFAEEMSEPAAGVAGEGSAPAGDATDDIAQFNAWLNGLKKT